jgi:peroxiredoxin Q/BCP
MKISKWLSSIVGVLLLPFTASADPLEIGAALPDAVGVDSGGKEVKLTEVASKGMTLFFFYPKANTGG